MVIRWIVLLPIRISLIHNSTISIFIYLKTYLGGGLAPSSQKVGSLLKSPLLAKPAWKNDILGNVVYCWIHHVNLLIPDNIGKNCQIILYGGLVLWPFLDIIKFYISLVTIMKDILLDRQAFFTFYLV